jgi:hypothetical protein
VRDHITALMDAGLSKRRIAELAGMRRKQIHAILAGRTDRGTGPPKFLSPATAQKVLAIPVPATPHENANAGALMWTYGTTRRLRALVAIGYTQTYLSERLGMRLTNASRLFNPPRRSRHGKHRRAPRVTAATARKVEALYRELENTPGPSRIAASRAKNLGWLPPIVWDEDTIDKPWPWLDRQVRQHLT